MRQNVKLILNVKIEQFEYLKALNSTVNSLSGFNKHNKSCKITNSPGIGKYFLLNQFK
jgi:hypothetical protein